MEKQWVVAWKRVSAVISWKGGLKGFPNNFIMRAQFEQNIRLKMI